jgi:hypothetical protein
MANRTTVNVRRIPGGLDLRFAVTISERSSSSNHEVTVSSATVAALRGDSDQPETLIEAAIRFLLDRERKESILARFDIAVIPRYFSDFESALPQYLAQARKNTGKS